MNSLFQTQHIPKIRRILFLGLVDPGVDYRKYQADGYAVWTLNDWYRIFPDLKPDRVFEIHERLDIEALQSQGRFPGDYRKIYNESGAQIITRRDRFFRHLPEPRDGFDNEKIFPLGTALEIFGRKFFVATTSYMFALAVMDGYLDITLEGIHLTSVDGHEYLIPGMLRNIDIVRAKGLSVTIPGDHEARWRSLAPTITENWRGIYG